MPTIHFSIDDLPPHLKKQALAQLNPPQPEHSAVRRWSAPIIKIPTAQPLPPKKDKTKAPKKRKPQSLQQNPASTNTDKDSRHSSRKKSYLHPSLLPTISTSHLYDPAAHTLSVRLNFSPALLPTAQQKGAFVGKDSRVHFFTKSHIAHAEKAFASLVAPYAHYAAQWGNVPIALSIFFAFPFPASTPRSKTYNFSPMDARPDTDNLIKGLCDAMTATGFWKDDSFIVSLQAAKCRTTQPPFILFSVKNLAQKFLFDLPNNNPNHAPSPLTDLPFLSLF